MFLLKGNIKGLKHAIIDDKRLQQGIQDFHRKYVLVPADKAANNVVVV